MKMDMTLTVRKKIPYSLVFSKLRNSNIEQLLYAYSILMAKFIRGRHFELEK
ncbi:hypothetical protein BGP_4308 [Beggiatoa sp. PS]|nr:hypothetical protein BGP_4308 [Beggiatoa sp. PS]